MSGPERQLQAMLEEYSPEVAACAKGALERLRRRMPGATQLVYDNYNALAIAFSPDGRPSHAVFSVTLYPRWVSLFFTDGASLSDAAGLLKGAGNKMRHVVLQSAEDLDRPELRLLIEEAMRRSGEGGGPGEGRLVIQSVSAKRRPRRVPG